MAPGCPAYAPGSVGATEHRSPKPHRGLAGASDERRNRSAPVQGEGSLRTPVSISCWPEEATFRAQVEEALEVSGPDRPGALQAHLRQAYPDLLVVARDSFGSVTAETHWYVYRDGSVMASHSAEPVR